MLAIFLAAHAAARRSISCVTARARTHTRNKFHSLLYIASHVHMHICPPQNQKKTLHVRTHMRLSDTGIAVLLRQNDRNNMGLMRVNKRPSDY